MPFSMSMLARSSFRLAVLLIAASGCRESSPEAVPGPATVPTGVVLGALDRGPAKRPFTIDLGRLPPRSLRTRPVRLTNASTSGPIVVDGFRASCECTEVTGLPAEVPPGESRDVEVKTDLGRDPEFTGGLTISVELTSRGSEVGRFQVDCQVERPADADGTP